MDGRLLGVSWNHSCPSVRVGTHIHTTARNKYFQVGVEHSEKCACESHGLDLLASGAESVLCGDSDVKKVVSKLWERASEVEQRMLHTNSESLNKRRP